MNRQRAQEIAESPVMANVSFNGMPIYIQNVDEENHTARIYPLDNPDKEMDVSLDELKEDYR